jgi:2'-deoxynucleoside 5'-phosphate N-hydrolase
MSNKNNTFGDSIFGNRVKDFRDRKGWKQDKLAGKANLSQSEISKIENGTIRVCEETIHFLADAFEVPFESLIRNTSYAAGLGIHPLANNGTANQSEPMIAYFASALTGLDAEQIKEIVELDEKVQEICTRYFNYSVALYRPRLTTSPTDNPDVSPRDVYDIDQERVVSADLVFFATIFPSLGAGMELQIALQSCTSIILIKKKGQPLSRMVTGCPAIIEIIEYEDLAELNKKLPASMDKLLPTASEARLTHRQQEDNFELGKRIEQLRIQRNYSEERLAKCIGVDEEYIKSLETKSEHIINPSLEITRRIARVLSTSVAYLLSGQHIDSTFVEHSDALRNYAEKTNMSVRELNELWLNHTDTYKNDLSMTGVKNRAEVGTEKYWKEQSEQLKERKEKGGRLFY